jgi:glycosyltransferase involved in cell wall biosynthesis
MKKDKLVVIPTLNEELSIVKIIRNIQSNIKDADILVVDGYSKDLTAQKSKSQGARVILVDKSFGIGLAVETGILFAYLYNYKFLIRMDGDGQHHIDDVKKMLKFSKQNNYDLVIGSRFNTLTEYKATGLRMAGIKLFNLLIRLIYKINIKDCTSGCQVLSYNFLKRIIKDKNFAYTEVGLICKAALLNMKIIEIDINMRARKSGESSFNFFNSFKYMFINLIGLISSIATTKDKK